MEDYIMYFFDCAIPLVSLQGELQITERRYENKFLELAKVWANVGEIESYTITLNGNINEFNMVGLDITINGVKIGKSEALFVY